MNKINLSPEARNDLVEIKRYITNELENPIAAISTTKRIMKAIRILQTHAEAGAPLFSIADVDPAYRFLVAGNYMIFYRAKGHDVYIDRVLYGHRNYLRILFGDTEEADIPE